MVWRIDRETRIGVPLTIENVFVEKHLYTDVRKDGTRSFKLERGLAGIEDSYIRVFRLKLAKGKALSTADLAHVAIFVAAMHSRTPRLRDHIRETWQQAVDIGENMQAAMAKKTSAERIAHAKIIPPPSSRDQPSMSLEQVKEIVRQPLKHSFAPYMRATARFLSRMQMCVATTTGNDEFITSDAPCVVFDPEAYKRPPMYRSPGLARKSVEITMPLSPRQLAIYRWWGLPHNSYRECPPELVAELNRRTQFHADQYIVSNRKETKDYWFVPGVMPNDAWENTAEARELEALRSTQVERDAEG